MTGGVLRDVVLIQAPSSIIITQFLVPPCKPPDPVKDFDDGHTYDLKKMVVVWTRMDVVPVRYRTFSQTFHLKMWFFQFSTVIIFK